MNFFDTVLDLIDMRSFSSLWFWIVLAWVWTRATFRVLGVPIDILAEAERGDPHAVDDVDGLGEMAARRLVARHAAMSLWELAALAFVFTVLVLLAWLYRIELAQALVCLAVPLAVVHWLTLRSARRVVAAAQQGETLRRTISALRLRIQAVAVVAIFVTTLYGMQQNLSIRPFGG
ncbi:hypothetical protein [Poseidonocella sedimentorum]|uniref:Component of SufBCD complex n=1 Tax=Poseidonocella sedimentorum TaxID=871652 RepID=A0A1I6EK00_9RHOB|nr:hypothetical protein [Poseidonocella sedimentorum]SFR17881.1 hypothetical protein SAMN04515673_11311 [Poseidonocella sedimentorum]